MHALPLSIDPGRAHRWDLDPAEAVEVQRRLAGLVSLEPPPGPLRTVAGCDVSYDAKLDRFYSAVLTMRLEDLAEVERVQDSGAIGYPYIPGLLSFREAPILLRALQRLEHRPDVLLMDAQGIAHPRRLGLASHLGVLLDAPAIGCAKSLLVGRHEEPGPEAGEWSPLIHRGEIVGAALRTRAGTKPVYVSPGHRMDLPTAIQVVMTCIRGTKLPEPTRLADRVVAEARRRELQRLSEEGPEPSEPVGSSE
jgi:deoxyribonuclease V